MSRLPFVLAIAFLLAGLPTRAHAQEILQSCKKFEMKNGSMSSSPVEGKPDVVRRHVTGSPIEITCDDVKLLADEIDWVEDEEIVHASGSVLLIQQGLTVSADRADLNRKTHLGTFYNASGIAQLSDKKDDRGLFGSLEPDAFFSGERLEKTGPRSYKLVGGTLTTCVQPSPRWHLSSKSVSITLDEHAVLRGAVLSVKDVPLLYLPVMYYPLSHEGRNTGFLMPQYGTSTNAGFTLSNAFFWAINRSQDATFYHERFSKTGQGFGANYEYVSAPGSNGDATVHVISEHALLAADAQTVRQPAHRSYSIRGNVGQTLPHGFRLQASSDYFTDVRTQQLYQQNIADFSQRARSVSASLSSSFRRFRLNVMADQRDYYYGLSSAQRAGHLPLAQFSIPDRPIGKSRIYYGGGGEFGYHVRQDDVSRPELSRSLWRFDGAPTIRAPISRLSFLSVSTQASWRITAWSESVLPTTHAQIPVAISRQLLDLRAQVTGPVFSRIFQTPGSGYAERFKHLIEPNIAVQWLSAFDRLDRVVQLDGIDTIVGGTTNLTYGVTNRLLAKRRTKAGPAIARDILSVSLNQSYYTNPLASTCDPQYQSSCNNLPGAQGTFSPLQLTAITRPFDSTTAQFRMEIDSKHRAIRTMSANGGLNSPNVQVTAGWTKQLFIPGLVGFNNPATAYHFLNANATLKLPDNRLGGSFVFNYDVHHNLFVQRRIVAYYNTQCCGISADLQTVNRAQFGLPNDRRFGLSFTLAGIGSFSNPLGSFGGGGTGR